MFEPKLPQANSIIDATDFIKSIKGLSGQDRENAFVKTLLGGNFPSSNRDLSEISLVFTDTNKVARKLSIFTTPDYLTIGSDSDGFRVPLWPTSAQAIADKWNCVLPTTKLVKIIWESSKKIQPEPWGPPYDSSMLSMERIVSHHEKIEKSIKSLGYEKTNILGGHKKDVVITNKLISKPSSVAIYGWHQLDGNPIQPLYLGHANNYADYSHGIRLISRFCLLDGQQDDITRIMCDKTLSHSISSEGRMLITGQP